MWKSRHKAKGKRQWVAQTRRQRRVGRRNAAKYEKAVFRTLQRFRALPWKNSGLTHIIRGSRGSKMKLSSPPGDKGHFF